MCRRRPSSGIARIPRRAMMSVSVPWNASLYESSFWKSKEVYDTSHNHLITFCCQKLRSTTGKQPVIWKVCCSNFVQSLELWIRQLMPNTFSFLMFALKWKKNITDFSWNLCFNNCGSDEWISVIFHNLELLDRSFSSRCILAVEYRQKHLYQSNITCAAGVICANDYFKNRTIVRGRIVSINDTRQLYC